MGKLSAIPTLATFSRQPFYAVAIRHAPAGLPVLDVGAGLGDFAEQLGDPDVHLVEGNPESAALLRRRWANVHEVTVPAPLPFADGSFGLIHCSHLIEHLQPAELYDLLREFDRCLAPGGKLAVSAPVLWDGFYNDLSHVKPYNPAVLEKYLCGGAEMARTRPAISQAYRAAELVWRWRFVPLPALASAQPGLGGVARLAGAVLRRLGIGTYERTGYTIVLEKSAAATS